MPAIGGSSLGDWRQSGFLNSAGAPLIASLTLGLHDVSTQLFAWRPPPLRLYRLIKLGLLCRILLASLSAKEGSCSLSYSS